MENYSYSLKFILDLKTVRNGNTHPIYAQVIVNRQKALISLHECADPNKFDAGKTGRIINPNRYEKYLNEKLLRVENQINIIRWEIEKSEKPITAKLIKQMFKGTEIESIKLLDFFDKQVQEMVKKKLHAKNTLAHYTVARDKLNSYLTSINCAAIAVDRVTQKHLHGFYNYMLDTIQVNSAINNMRKVRAILGLAVKNEIISVNPFSHYKMVVVKSNRIALTAEELRAITSYSLENESLIKVRDLFLFSVYTGLRYKDAQNLTADKIKNDADGRLWIETVQDKTGKLVLIPLLSPARAIYDKYQKYREATTKILMPLSNQKLNTYLKTIANLINLKKPLTHHVARHTFATTILLENNIDIRSTSELLGHGNLSTTMAYAHATRKVLSNAADSVEEALTKYNIKIKTLR